MKAAVLLSGGMDSATLLYYLRSVGFSDFLALSFNYGQRHAREISAARELAKVLDIQHQEVDLRMITNLLPGSALTDRSVDVPEGHYTAENMRLTVVPNRNAIMLSIAAGIAAAHGIPVVGTAIHAGDHAIYPDCRPGFLSAFNDMVRNALGEMWQVEVLAPFVGIAKQEIAAIGKDLGVPYELTWSCYNGRHLHCGKCGTCVERKEAFMLAGMEDPTVYEDPSLSAVV